MRRVGMFPADKKSIQHLEKDSDGRAVICPRKMLAVMMAAILTAPAMALPSGERQQRPQSPQPQDPRARIRATVDLVVVPVTVKDTSRKILDDIRQNEFRVFADGIEQNISVFSADPFPLSAVVLVDNGLKTKAAAMMQETLRAIASGFSDQDEVSICRFDTGFQRLGDFTSDNDQLLTQLGRVELGSAFPGEGSAPMTAGPRINGVPVPGAPMPGQIQIQGAEIKNLDDAVYAAGELLKGRDRARRKIILLISDGLNSRHNTHKYDETLRLLLRSEISVYAIGLGEALLNRGFTRPSRYARETGGDIYYAAKRADLETLYAQLTEEARNQYTLGFVPEKVDRSLEYHTLEVRVRRPDLVLLSRQGYYSTPRP